MMLISDVLVAPLGSGAACGVDCWTLGRPAFPTDVCCKQTPTDAQERSGQSADQDRFPALHFGQPGGRKPDDDCVVP